MPLPQDLESPDGAIPSSASPPEGDSQVTVATQPPPPSQVTITTQPPSPARVEQPPPSPQESPSRLQEKVGILQEALDQAEQQRELINSEYRRLLGEKEVPVVGRFLEDLPGMWCDTVRLRIVTRGEEIFPGIGGCGLVVGGVCSSWCYLQLLVLGEVILWELAAKPAKWFTL